MIEFSVATCTLPKKPHCKSPTAVLPVSRTPLHKRGKV